VAAAIEAGGGRFEIDPDGAAFRSKYKEEEHAGGCGC
jgi:hypothetical protein